MRSRSPAYAALAAFAITASVLALVLVSGAQADNAYRVIAPGIAADSAGTPTPAATSTAEPGAEPDRGPTAANRMTWLGQDWYLHGVNVAWLNWACDFGCLEHGGVSSAASQDELRPRLAQAKAAGFQNFRWWLFPGEPWQIDRDAEDTPTRINPAVFPDFDAALALAEEYDLYLTLVLFAGADNLPSSWLTDPDHRARLANILGDELFARYRGHPHVFSWEVFNEPEWEIWDGRADLQGVQELVRLVANQVKAKGSGYVTVEWAMVDGIPLWKDAGLDYYQPHWYDAMDSGTWCAYCTTAEAIREMFDIDEPIVIGEMYAGSAVDSLERYQHFRDAGYAGAWPWSLFPERTHDGMTIDFDAAKAFAELDDDIGPRAAE
jgi:hypothetical protein